MSDRDDATERPRSELLRGARLVYIAPESGSGGVGDYATDFVEAVRPHLGSVVEIRHGAPGSLTLRELLAQRASLRRLVAEPGAPDTIVHAEQSGGGILPFWAPYRLRVGANTATVHDPPLAVWFPLRTRLLARHRLLGHAVNFPLSLVGGLLESRVNAGRHLFALSRTGAAALDSVMTRSTVSAASMVVPERVPLPAVADRPAAIGLFGYVYRGKGFESLRMLRESLDDDILIRVAGRGTAELPGIPGVEVLGEVEGPQEDAFFASIRMLVVPYTARTVYFREALPAASTVTRAFAYRTPVLCTRQGALRELADDGGVLQVDGGAQALAFAANSAVWDSELLGRLESETAILGAQRTADAVVDSFLRVWSVRLRSSQRRSSRGGVPRIRAGAR